MENLDKFEFTKNTSGENSSIEWSNFLKKENFDLSQVSKIVFLHSSPIIYDLAGNKFSIDFNENKLNYHKKKGSIKTELIGRAMGAGRAGLRVLDLSAGLGIDAIFLSQLGYQVTALERNPLIYLALQTAWNHLLTAKEKINFVYSSALDYFKTTDQTFDVIYFDPMFPDKIKTALPRQEMVFFRNLVGDDVDAQTVLESALKFKNVERIVVKRPAKAPILGGKPHSEVSGKLVRFDIYGAKK